MNKVKYIIVMVLAAALLAIGACTGPDEYTTRMNEDSANKVYISAVNDGLIDGKHQYKIEKAEVDDQGIAKSYDVIIQYPYGVVTVRYPVE